MELTVTKISIAIILIQAVAIYLLILKCNKWKKECYRWMNKYIKTKKKWINF